MSHDDANRLLIAIDGPAGAGKSSVARLVAQRLGAAYVDTGAMYRAVTWVSQQRGLDDDPPDDTALAALVSDLDLRLDDTGAVLLNGEPVGDELRSRAVTKGVSAISSLGSVREAMVRLQRVIAVDLASRGIGVVMDGRDIGSYVFPDARCRLYLDASVAERARRRKAQEEARGASTLPLDEWVSRIERRDHLDSHRELAPLRIADGATVVDTTELTESEVVERVLALARAARGEAGGR